MTTPSVVAVLGAGIAGLTVASELDRKGFRVHVYEERDKPGGVIRSEQINGFLIEHGPNSIQPPPLVQELIARVGLEEVVVEANAVQKNRFVVRDGILIPVPLGPGDLLRTPLFSWRGKLRVLAEPFIKPGSGAESVAEFVRRRVGREFLDYAINPFVAGVFAGDPERLSVRHAFPRMVALEKQHGSLIRGMVASRRSGAPTQRKPLISFRDGLRMLPEALASRLSEPVRFRQTVQRIVPDASGWLVETAADRERVDAVVSTLPIHRMEGILPRSESLSAAVDYAAVTVVALGYRREQVGHPLNGFGLLVPEVESDIRILGALFSSTLFPGRAPDGAVLVTAFLGGMRHRYASYLQGADAVSVAHHDLARLLSVQGTPCFSHTVTWPAAIPQYDLRYAETLAIMDSTERAHPGLFFAGNYRGGISVVDTIASATEVAKRVAGFVESDFTPARPSD